MLDELSWNYFGSGGWTLDHQGSFNKQLQGWIDTVKDSRGAVFFTQFPDFYTEGWVLYGSWRISDRVQDMTKNDYLLVGIQTTSDPDTRVAMLGRDSNGKFFTKTYEDWQVA